MKISDVAISDLKQYANVYQSDDDNLFTAILAACKQFISTYTGLPLTTTTDANAIKTAIQVKYSDAVVTVNGSTITVSSSTQNIGQDTGWLQFQIQTVTGVIFDIVTISADNHTVTLTAESCDDHEDLTIALMVLSNEMYDNRAFVVDNTKLNFVIKQILDSHSVNYL